MLFGPKQKGYQKAEQCKSRQISYDPLSHPRNCEQ
jgi:hypothetical protein